MRKLTFTTLTRILVWPVVVLAMLISNSCDKTSDNPDPDPDPSSSEFSKLKGVVFPKQGASSNITATFYTNAGSTNIVKKFTPKNYITNRSNVLTEGQRVYFKDLDSESPKLCIEGGTISVVSPATKKEEVFPVLSPVFGNKDIELPVNIVYEKSPELNKWTFTGRYECEEYSLDISGEIPSKLNNVTLNLSYYLKNYSGDPTTSNKKWFTLFKNKESIGSGVESPFAFEGIDPFFSVNSQYSGRDILQFVLNAPAISASGLGFTKDENITFSLTQLYQIICYGMTYADLGRNTGYLNPQYYYYEQDRSQGNAAEVYFDMSMPYYSFEYTKVSDNKLKVFVNLSSLLNMKLCLNTYREHGGVSGAQYYPLNTDLYKLLQFNIAKSFVNNSSTGIELNIKTEGDTEGKVITAYFSDKAVAKSLLIALFSVYSSDSGNMGRLRTALQGSDFSASAQDIVNVISNLGTQIDKCPGFTFGFRYNYYWIISDNSFGIYKDLWGNIGIIFGWH